jgi:Fe-S cluster assembly protein SufD
MKTDNASERVRLLGERDPGWVADLRSRAWSAFRELPFPQGREETWRFTDLDFLRLDDYEVLPPDHKTSATTTPSSELTGVNPSGRMVHADGSLAHIELSDEARKAGVLWMDLDTACAEREDLIRPLLGTLVPPDDVFTAFALAAHRGGSFLYVPPNVELEAPFQALHVIGEQGASIWPRTVVVIGRGSRVVFNDVYSSKDLSTPTLAGPVTEVFAGEGASVGFLTWQDWGRGVRHLGRLKVHLDKDASLNTLLVTMGGDFSRTWKECALAGPGAQSIMLGLFFSHRDQRFEHWTVQDHVAPRAHSDLLYKGALTDVSTAVYYGTIRVRPGAHGTDAYQANRNLVLSPKAKADTNPQLEIENQDVRCTHGATVGRVDENQMFYLMSRGIPRPEAERLIVSGFFEQVLARAQWSGMHDQLAAAVERKLSA